MSKDMIYLDYAATTPTDPRVADIMNQHLTFDVDFGNPSSNHVAGRRASAAVERAGKQLAGLLDCKPGELVWTSGANESDNLAIIGGAHYRASRGKHLMTMPTEHKAVTATFKALEKQGFEVTWLQPDERGRLHIGKFEAALRDDTQLVSIMYVNNETGVTQNIEAIGALCRERDVLFHVDAAQAVGKLPIDLASLPVDLMSMTAHKMYGPKGIGALYIADRPGCRIEAQMYGGGPHSATRPGTLAVHLIAGFGLAADIAGGSMDADIEHLNVLNERLWFGLSKVSGIVRNGDAEHAFPGILNVSVDDIEGESLLLALEPLCIATGSACNAKNAEPSYVLRALGRSDAEAQSAIRFSMGRHTTKSDVDLAVQIYRDAVSKLRRIAPDQAA